MDRRPQSSHRRRESKPASRVTTARGATARSRSARGECGTSVALEPSGEKKDIPATYAPGRGSSSPGGRAGAGRRHPDHRPRGRMVAPGRDRVAAGQVIEGAVGACTKVDRAGNPGLQERVAGRRTGGIQPPDLTPAVLGEEVAPPPGREKA